jgi:acyl-coenzyme A thioesterase PaaI-like protein
MHMAQSIGPGLRKAWRSLSALPAGRWLFSVLLGRYVPYTGTIGATVEVLEPGHSVVVLRERRRVRNHLDSVHAMALANLGEMATGLALISSLPDRARGILRRFDIDYLKKARGRLTAECYCEVPESNEEREFDVACDIRDRSGEVVSHVVAHWLIGPERIS